MATTEMRTLAPAKGGKGTPNKNGGDSADGSTGKKKSMKMKIIILVVLLAAAGVGAKLTVLAPKKKAAATAVVVKPVPGPVIKLDDQTLNLSGGHFLVLQINVQATKGTDPALDMTEGVQAVIDMYSNKSVLDLTGQAARDKYLQVLIGRLKALYPKKIMGGFYGKFTMQ
jgi:flagellar FliL protein